jgi:hypothetical protein
LHPTRFYSGFDQALALKHVAGVREVYVMHIVKAVNEKYMEGLRRLCEATGVKAIVYSEVSGLHAIGE